MIKPRPIRSIILPGVKNSSFLWLLQANIPFGRGKTIQGAAMNLSRVIFGNTNYDAMVWDNKARYVIERVVTYGTTSDWRAIQKKKLGTGWWLMSKMSPLRGSYHRQRI